EESIFNCACGDQVSIQDLISELNCILQKNLNPIFAEARPGDICNSYADVSRTVCHLKYEPGVRFKEGLKRTVEWFLSNEFSFGAKPHPVNEPRIKFIEGDEVTKVSPLRLESPYNLREMDRAAILRRTRTENS
ncbi:hypothetical protein MJD09_21500, partial [bacterium]|nr:hypothetical protein [bacterium]